MSTLSTITRSSSVGFRLDRAIGLPQIAGSTAHTPSRAVRRRRRATSIVRRVRRAPRTELERLRPRESSGGRARHRRRRAQTMRHRAARRDRTVHRHRDAAPLPRMEHAWSRSRPSNAVPVTMCPVPPVGSAVELVTEPRCARQLLVKGRSVADAAPHELGPFGNGRPSRWGIGEEIPHLRMVPTEIVACAVAMGSDRGSHRSRGLEEFRSVQSIQVLIHREHCRSTCCEPLPTIPPMCHLSPAQGAGWPRQLARVAQSGDGRRCRRADRTPRERLDQPRPDPRRLRDALYRWFRAPSAGDGTARLTRSGPAPARSPRNPLRIAALDRRGVR